MDNLLLVPCFYFLIGLLLVFGNIHCPHFRFFFRSSIFHSFRNLPTTSPPTFQPHNPPPTYQPTSNLPTHLQPTNPPPTYQPTSNLPTYLQPTNPPSTPTARPSISRPYFTERLQDLEAVEGDHVRLTVASQAFPPPQYTWQKDGRSLDSHLNWHRYQVDQNGDRWVGTPGLDEKSLEIWD